MATTKPNKLTLRSYQVGFGDCFLLTFHYPKFDRHILIDFGSTGIPKSSESKKKSADKLMTRVAKDIQAQCGGKLHAIVATHRHQDHIKGDVLRVLRDRALKELDTVIDVDGLLQQRRARTLRR